MDHHIPKTPIFSVYDLNMQAHTLTMRCFISILVCLSLSAEISHLAEEQVIDQGGGHYKRRLNLIFT